MIGASSGRGRCLDNKPTVRRFLIAAALPGQIHDSTAQCRFQFGPSSVRCNKTMASLINVTVLRCIVVPPKLVIFVQNRRCLSCWAWASLFTSRKLPGEYWEWMGDRIRVQLRVLETLYRYNQLLGLTQPGHPFVGRRSEYQPVGSDALRLRSKGRYCGMARVWWQVKCAWSFVKLVSYPSALKGCQRLVKKRPTIFPFITFPNIGWFLKFCHLWIQKEIGNNTLVMYSTTP